MALVLRYNLKRRVILYSQIILFCISVILVAVAFIARQYLANRYLNIFEPLLFGISGSLFAVCFASLILLPREEWQEHFIKMGITEVWENRKGRSETSQQVIPWFELVERAKRKCLLLGISLSGYVDDENALDEFERIIQKSIKSVKFNILFLDPDCQCAKLRNIEERKFGEHTIERIMTAICNYWELREKLSEKYRENFMLYIYQSTPTFSVTWLDNYMIVTHYLPKTPDTNCPALGVHAARIGKGETGLYDVYQRNVELIKNDAQLLTYEHIEKYKESLKILKEKNGQL